VVRRIRWRRFAIPFSCGVACSSLVWICAHPFALWVPLAGGCAAVAFESASKDHRGSALDGALAAGALAIPLWSVLEVIVVPLSSGRAPAWTAPEMRSLFPALVGWMLYGCALGVAISAVARFMPRTDGAAPRVKTEPGEKPKHVVILGGGFAGTTTAVKLEEALGADRSIEITLVSETNALLFTPMLAEVAGSSVEPTHISSPLRASLRRTHVVRARVSAIELDGRSVELEPDESDAEPRRLSYDHLILALGSASNFFGQSTIRHVAMEFKSLPDAIRIRNRVIAVFERADRERDDAVRRRLLTFVVAGGGFAGIELAGALNDFARGILIDYPNVSSDDVRVLVVHARERILPELSETLAAYAQARMIERGVTFRLNVRVADATPNAVILDNAEVIDAGTLVWAAGTVPNPLLANLDIERDKRGAVIVDDCMAVPNRAGLWALGDCAAIPNPSSGGTYPPTAQHAVREAASLALNVRAAVRGERLRPFAFDSPGALCVIGHQNACAEIREPLLGRRLIFSGAFAWLLWRAIYLGKLPGLERKVRVLTDWVTELFFPRDTVETIE
jgi:NADH:ubiquinone reductase (H+-translocating)